MYFLQWKYAESSVVQRYFEAAETLDKSYISDHLKEPEGDLLYNVPLRDSKVYIYILLEFQSTVPRFMAP